MGSITHPVPRSSRYRRKRCSPSARRYGRSRFDVSVMMRSSATRPCATAVAEALARMHAMSPPDVRPYSSGIRRAQEDGEPCDWSIRNFRDVGHAPDITVLLVPWDIRDVRDVPDVPDVPDSRNVGKRYISGISRMSRTSAGGDAPPLPVSVFGARQRSGFLPRKEILRKP